MKTVHQFTLLILIQSIKLSNSQVVTLILDQPSYSVYAVPGSTLTMTCLGTGLTQSDIVWKYYSIANNASITTIYFSNLAIASPTKFTVSNSVSGLNSITSTLTFNTISLSDADFIYQCACNIYTACSNAAVAASASIKILTTTTSTTSTTSTTTTSTSTTTTTTSTTTTTTSTTTTTTPPPKQWCIDGNYNTAQYVLIIMCNVVILIATLLFHFSFQSSLVETFFLALLLILSVFSIVTSVIFWINPELIGDKSYANVIIVSCGLFSLLLQWVLIIQYGIRLALSNQIKSVVIALVCIDGFLEATAGGVIIFANLYCTGKTSLPSIDGFNYSYIEVIGSISLVMFALILLLISGVIFFIRKNKKDLFMFNNLKSLSTGVVSPLHYQGIFVPNGTGASGPRTPGRIHEMWFANQTKIEPFMENQNSMNNVSRMNSIYPPKPTKLTPLYARKRSEITNIDDSLFSKVKQNKKNLVEDILKETTSKAASSELNDSMNNIREVKKTKKKKAKKKDTVQPVESAPSNVIDQIEEIINADAVEPFDTNISRDLAESVETKTNNSNVSNENQYNNSNIATEIPLASSIDSIWNINVLQPSIDESVSLGTINEEFSESKLNKSRILGARRVKTAIGERSPLEDSAETANSLNRENTDTSLRFANSAKRSKSIDFFKSLNQNSFDDDDHIILVDEFNRENEPSSSSSSNLIRRSSAKNE